MRLPENRKLNVYKSIHRSCPSEDEDTVSVSMAKSMVEGQMPLILNYSLYNKEMFCLLLVSFWPSHMACGILVPQSRMELWAQQ